MRKILDSTRHYDKRYPKFPFLFSMLQEGSLDLNSSWQNQHIYEQILSTTKTEIDKDLRFSSLYSYLASIKRPFEIDRFTLLWTSMNAYYSYVSGGVKGDHQKMDDLIKSMRLGDGKPSRKCQKVYELLYESVGDSLVGLSKEHIEEVCAILSVNPTAKSIQFRDGRLNPINDLAEKLSITPYGLMLLEYPYHWRCRYSHGESATILFSTHNNDRAISILRVLNCLLTDFLGKEIPKLFDILTNYD